MSYRYPPQHKAAVLAQLQANHSNVILTSIQTGIPERTIRDWRRKAYLQNQLPVLPPHTPSAAAATPEFEEESQALQYVRRQIVQEVANMAATLKDTLDTAAPYHRILALSQLLDRLIKLDILIPQTQREQVIRVEYTYPDGSFHSTPPWATGETWSPFWSERDEHLRSPETTPSDSKSESQLQDFP